MKGYNCRGRDWLVYVDRNGRLVGILLIGWGEKTCLLVVLDWKLGIGGIEYPNRCGCGMG